MNRIFLLFALGVLVAFSAMGVAVMYQYRDGAQNLLNQYFASRTGTPSPFPSPSATAAASFSPFAFPTPSHAPIAGDYAALANMPAALKQCVAQSVGTGVLDKVISGGQEPPQNMGTVFNACCVKPTIVSGCAAFARQTKALSEESITFLLRISPYVAKGQTPGQCNSLESCNDYCDASAHQNECTDFFYKIGTFPDSTMNQIKQLVANIKQALDAGSVGLQQCVIQTVGAQALQEILNGTKLPPQNIANTFNECDLSVAKQAQAALNLVKQMIASSTPEFQQCVQAGAGGKTQLDGILSGIYQPPANFGDAIDACVKTEVAREAAAAAIAQQQQQDFQLRLQELVNARLDELNACVVGQVGVDMFNQVMVTGSSTPEMIAALQYCVNLLNP